MDNLVYDQTIFKNALLGDLVLIAKALVSDTSSNIIYSFVNDGVMTDSIYEFKFKNQLSGEIYLAKSLNRSTVIQREV